MSTGRKISIGFFSTFASLTIVCIVGFVETIKHTSFRGGYAGDKSDSWFILTLTLMALITMLPLLLWIEDLKSYAKGALWGAISFYILSAIAFSMWIGG